MAQRKLFEGSEVLDLLLQNRKTNQEYHLQKAPGASLDTKGIPRKAAGTSELHKCCRVQSTPAGRSTLNVSCKRQLATGHLWATSCSLKEATGDLRFHLGYSMNLHRPILTRDLCSRRCPVDFEH